MKKFIFLLLSLAVIFSTAIIPTFAAAHIDVDPSQNFIMPRETNVNTDTDSNILDSLDSMIPDSMGTNVPDSAVESNSAPESTSPITTDKPDGTQDDGTSSLIGIIIAIIAVIAVIVLVVLLVPKSKNKK